MGKDFKVYTKTGDDGTTGLVGGTRVKKYDARLDAYGTVDELNAAIGVLRSYDLDEEVKELLVFIQNKLFNIGSRLASDEKGEVFTVELKIKPEDIDQLERAMDEYEKKLPPLTDFVLPGGDLAVAQCHVARTVCRRAERGIVEFAEHAEVQLETLQFINRLSDYFFVLARKLTHETNIEEKKWNKNL